MVFNMAFHPFGSGTGQSAAHATAVHASARGDGSAS
jgi:hypothetical protein